MDITLKPLEKNALIFKRIKSKNEIGNEEVSGYLINSDEKEVRRIIDFLKDKKKIIAVLGRDDEFNRRMLEKTKINYLVSPEVGIRKDTLKQRDSGLNHVLAKIARDNKIGIVIDFSDILKLSGKELALRLAKVMQNIKVCRRAGCKIKIASFASDKSELRGERELKSFLFSLGASSEQASGACEF